MATMGQTTHTTSLVAILAIAIPAATTLLGVFVGRALEQRAAHVASRAAAQAQRRTELAAALASYMGVVELIAFELSRNPPSSRLDRQLDRLPRGRLHYLFSTVLERLATGSQFAQLR